MSVLTTRQRDLLQILLDAGNPLGAADIASQMQLTPRQVNYGLKGLRSWLALRDVDLKVTPGIGVMLNCSPAQSRDLMQDLNSDSGIQLVLSAEERQQLLALYLIVIDEPVILFQLQGLTQVSRTTVLKDLETIEVWASTFALQLERRPNYGIWLVGAEQNRRQAITALLWGQTNFGESLSRMSYNKGLVFSLDNDVELLPIAKQVKKYIREWDTNRTFSQVAYAEAQLDGRFTDNAVLFLALVFAIQTERIEKGHFLTIKPQHIEWLQKRPVWAVAATIAKRLGWRLTTRWPEAEVASTAMYLMTSPRNDRWPDDLEIDFSFESLIDVIMEHIGKAYQLYALTQDRTLRDGIVIHIIPACLQQRFHLWLPSQKPTTNLSQRYAFEHNLAHEIALMVEQHTAVMLPPNETNNIALLLRAAFIREKPNRVQKVIVVCPSGMATAQLLVARLKARFPRMGNLEVISLRELNGEKVAAAELIITTVPLSHTFDTPIDVIQVHPLLLPKDIEAITARLT